MRGSRAAQLGRRSSLTILGWLIGLVAAMSCEIQRDLPVERGTSLHLRLQERSPKPLATPTQLIIHCKRYTTSTLASLEINVLLRLVPHLHRLEQQQRMIIQ